jgi:hypothetical protein
LIAKLQRLKKIPGAETPLASHATALAFSDLSQGHGFHADDQVFILTS